MQGHHFLRLPWLVFLLLRASAEDSGNSTKPEEKVTCERDHEYDSLDIRDVTGKWNVEELYMHLKKEGVKQYNTCPTVTIWETEEIPHTTFGVGFHLKVSNKCTSISKLFAKRNEELFDSEEKYTKEKFLFLMKTISLISFMYL